MKIQQIRSATLKLNFAGTTFLIDPWLASRWAMGCFADLGGRFTVPDPVKRHIPMPICPLPISITANKGALSVLIMIALFLPLCVFYLFLLIL